MKKRGMYTGILAVLLLCACACTGQSADRPGTVEDVTAPTVATEQLTESVYPEHIENAFAGQEDTPASELSYTGERELTITGYSGKAGIVRIPAEIAGKPVVAIAAEAFAGNTALTALYVPKTVREIAAGALDQCTALRTLKMPRLYGKAEESRYLGYLFGAQDYNDNAKKVPASFCMRKPKSTRMPFSTATIFSVFPWETRQCGSANLLFTDVRRCSIATSGRQ